jgi:hypothetical protein
MFSRGERNQAINNISFVLLTSVSSKELLPLVLFL